MSTAGPPTEAVAYLCAGASLEAASLLTLWLGTAPWTDYAFIALICTALVALTVGAIVWIGGGDKPTS